MLAPLDPKLKIETLAGIKQKETFSQQDIEILFRNATVPSNSSPKL